MTRHRPMAVRAVFGLLVFLGITAVAGGVEIAFLPARSWLEAVYGAVGVLLALMPALPSVRRHLGANARRAR
ncbi:hypothetical protein Asp14428_74160 [Actinoplanes sp. NBRC 14428]|uniref:Uncharacterized protein n=1 Tax=Pseudosporangium ferrugineum TaxID=439699 RepID=A0A2T0RJL0_9ACTN|nr:hypothetical protein [Pseudosporangium ferrugineum]PRY21307.1 hypothetical protein CLV70_12016 [Pseudosporangium ferrugineum]BCJ55941.1 hypothetical protein Asp14428_74160 [Actinoplanes sp. NBRC 14428]